MPLSADRDTSLWDTVGAARVPVGALRATPRTGSANGEKFASFPLRSH